MFKRNEKSKLNLMGNQKFEMKSKKTILQFTHLRKNLCSKYIFVKTTS